MTTFQRSNTFINKIVMRGMYMGGMTGMAIEFADKSPPIIIFGTKGDNITDPYSTWTSYGNGTVTLNAPNGFDEMRLGINEYTNAINFIQNISIYKGGGLVDEFNTSADKCCGGKLFTTSGIKVWQKHLYTIKSKGQAYGLALNAILPMSPFQSNIQFNIKISNLIPMLPSPVDGGLSGWSNWSTCNAIDSTQTRTRTCTNPVPSYGGKPCSELDLIESRLCPPINGGLSGWGLWGECTLDSNGALTQSRTQTCTDPVPAYGGAGCVIPPVETRFCPVDGKWSEWGEWSKCYTNLVDDSGIPKRFRERSCNNPPPSNGGSQCFGEQKEISDICPPVNGGLSEWSDWGMCIKESDGQTRRSRSKVCNNPYPSFGGADCTGIAYDTELCPVDGGLTPWWGPWGECSRDESGVLKKTRTKTCTQPSPENGGADCGILPIDTELCPEPINGGLSDWTNWDNCFPDKNGVLRQSRTQYCNNPLPEYGGADCGDLPVNTRICPINGGLSNWSDFGECVMGDGGIARHSKTKYCNNPAPANGGADCGVLPIYTEVCYLPGETNKWSEWSEWSDCYIDTDRVDKRMRTKTCKRPNTENGSSTCGVQPIEYSRCPIRGGVSEWTDWSECIKDVDLVMKKTRTRLCNNPVPAYGGADCGNILEEKQTCFDPTIPIPNTSEVYGVYDNKYDKLTNTVVETPNSPAQVIITPTSTNSDIPTDSYTSLIVIIVVVVLAGLLGGGYFIYKNYTQKKGKESNIGSEYVNEKGF